MDDPPPGGRAFAAHGPTIIFGDLVNGDQFKRYDGGAGRSSIVPVRVGPAEPAGWQPGADVEAGGEAYLLHEPHLAEHPSSDGSFVHRQARALRTAPDRGRTGHVWLRQVVVRKKTPAARRAVDALLRERVLIDRLAEAAPGIPRLPRVRGLDENPPVTLVLTWPEMKSGKPCPGLDVAFSPGPTTRHQKFGLFKGLGSLCETLARLHGRGISHRAIAPSAVIDLGRDGFGLRDLGLAGREPAPNEGPALYRAPEQRRRERPGAHTDVYQVAAVAHHLLTGHPPDPRGPLPMAAGLPPAIGGALHAALAPEPADRPDVRALAGAFREAADHLSRET